MGIKNLNSLILKYAEKGVLKKHLSSYSGMRIAIDANVYIYKYLYGNSNCINGLFFQINKFKKFNISPIYIFDGKPPPEKELTLLQRKLNKNKIKNKILECENQILLINKNDSLDTQSKETLKAELEDEINNLNKKLIFITKDVLEKIILLLDFMGINYIFAPCEAEHYCSKLIKNNLVDLVLSEDMDTIACGSNRILRKFSNKTDFVFEYNLFEILNLLNLSYSQFIDMCILCGNDYVNRIKDTDHNLAYKLIKRYKTI